MHGGQSGFGRAHAACQAFGNLTPQIDFALFADEGLFAQACIAQGVIKPLHIKFAGQSGKGRIFTHGFSQILSGHSKAHGCGALIQTGFGDKAR